ncbi:MAG: PAS domain S-box protein [Gammaproteobacteria bacterium]|mgnify:FL=1|jgi:PAS domain S-box-containing protein|nr:PAS domain S-box protein [Gammaproteobacteria bacterium]MBU0853145.1 PAS domain S-box protein [Gammaproteobacteria bacterium]MBU1303355.1 PAS domain S-box protein [Gammaproteobacteria bacterium]MBU1458017.1 PAS domain S-box protein [Gammaproteobacteria bacterium]MBU2283373.1 PAS domain S-box protein [Gammaproteobacteria bacterium]|tara:strand:+ start:30698 stop:33100 length:2403 start_codon:yes stop_codon:yes gene_type:complete
MESSKSIPAPSPPRELSRLAALLRYEILDTPDESAFDDFTELAAYICDTPIALISLVDDHRQWFKSRLGLEVSETPRELSFCTYTIEGEGVFEVEDAHRDTRFSDNPLVTGDPHIRFYAGAPLISPDGYNLGTLCVIDRQPRQLSEAQRGALERLSRQIMRLFEERLQAHRYAEQAALQQALLNSAASAMLVTTDDGHISGVNPTAERLFGYSEQMLIGQPLTSVLFPEEALQRRATILGNALGEPIEPGFAVLTAPLLEGRREMREWRLLHRNGSGVPVLLNVSAIHDERELLRGYIVSAYDLAHQEHLQLRLQQIAAQVPGMLFQFCWRPDGNSSFPYLSEGVEDIYGLSAAEMAPSIGPIYERVHPEDREHVLASIRQAASTLTPWHFEHRIDHPRKGIIWVEARATPMRQADGSVLWHGLVTDVTERKAEQLELDKQQEMNRRLLEALSEGVVACDADCNLTLFNHTARRWHGLDAEQIEPEHWPDAYHLYHADGTTPMVTDELPLIRALRGEHIRNLEMAIVLHGTPRYVLANADPMYASNGQQNGAVVVLHDITERKQIENLQRDFVSTVSHELRTPLTSITASLGLICGRVMGEVPEHLQELLEIAHQNSKRLSTLIDDLLDIDKLYAGKMRFELRAQPLQPLLEQALRSNQGYAESHAVSIELGDCPAVSITVDAMRLEQVMSNLLSNAAKYSPPGETVAMSAQLIDPQRVRVSVCDKGPGISEAFRERIFSKFAQADSSDTRKQGGTGLGLAISKELIEHMDGVIGFDSTPGAGACFWFELPCHALNGASE